MAEKINLRSSKVKEQKRRVSEYGTETPLPSTAVERGTTRWLNGSTVVIQGLLDVTGTTTISGVLNVSGQTTLSGATTIAGPTGITGALTIQGLTTISGKLDVTGPTKLAGKLDIGGDTTITGKLDITGKTTVKNDLELLSGGLFKAGVTKIEPTGKATFGTFIIDPSSDKLIQAPGGWLFTNGPDNLGLSSSVTSSLNLNADRAEIVYGSTARVVARPSAIDLTAAKTWVSGEIEVAGRARFQNANFYVPNLPPTSARPNIYLGPDGRLFVSSWTP